MALTPGSRLGPYEVTALLGEGGMGQVYRATDTHLKRQVAIKVLPASVAGDADRLARFQREAEVLAALNHPHIAAIYGLEKPPELTALVMELVEGADLSDRIARGPLPLDEALAIARQIAEALEAAHEQGIIHRDLKPANVKVRDDGTVKVLDFGLAKAMDPTASSTGEALQAATITTPAMTQAGMILGTAAYMSPEQARGKAVDKRADIWAFGAVLYEMLTGVRAFKGEEVSDTLARVLMQEPDWALLPPATPAPVVAVLKRCLQKDRRKRLRDMGDVALALDGAFETSAPPAAANRILAAGGWALAALLAAGLAVSSFAGADHGAADVPVRRFTLDLPWTTVANWTDFGVAVSADGRQVAYNCRHDNLVSLCVRPLDSLTARPVIEARDADEWFFSPDGEWLVLVDTTGVSKVSVRGGQPQMLHRWASAETEGSGFSWTSPDYMLFATPAGLQRLAAAGGTPEPLTAPDASGDIVGHLYPQALEGDDGRLVVTLRHRDGTSTAGIVTLADKSVRDLGIRGSRFVHIPGWLVFKQGTTLLAVAFDAASLRATGNAIPMIENVRTPPRIARDGTLVYVPTRGDAKARLVWVDRQGRATPVPDERRDYSHLDLAPDDSRALLNLDDGGIYVVDLQRGTRKRLAQGAFPIWTHDGQRVAYGSENGLWSVSADGGGTPERLLESRAQLVPTSWNSRTGDLAYYDHRAFEVMVRTPRGEPRQVIAGAGRKRSARFSPDGTSIAYVSDETGEYQVYATSYPDPGPVVAVSSTGGLSPIWSSDGRELFFRHGSKVMRARVASTAPLRFDAAAELFDGPYTLDLMGHQREDVNATGQSFLMVENSDDFPIVLVQNWVRELAAAAQK